MKIAFLGVGIMGRPMAGHLQAGGHELLLLRHRSPLPEELIAGGAVAYASAREAAAAADAVILMLPDTPDVDSVLFGADGVAAGLRRGGIVIDMSSIDPIRTRSFAERIVALGCDYVDAPVSGGEVGAKAASLPRPAQDDVPISVEGPGFLDCNLYRQPGRLVLHLGNVSHESRNPMKDVIPIGPIKVRVRIDPGMGSAPTARLLVSDASVAVTYRNGWAEVQIPTIGLHEVVVIGAPA